MNDLLTEEDAAGLLGCAVQTVQDKARDRELPGVKFGRCWRFPRSALLEVLHSQAMDNIKPKAAPVPVAVLKSVGKVARQPPALAGGAVARREP